MYEDPAYPLSSQLLIARGLGYRVSVYIESYLEVHGGYLSSGFSVIK